MSPEVNSRSELTLRVLDVLGQERLLAFAVLSPDLTVLEVSENFRQFQGDSGIEPVGKSVLDLIWELVGSESGLKEVLSGALDVFNLQNINRQHSDGSIHYLSIKTVPIQENNPNKGLLLILEDTTFTSTLEQQLVQDRNVLRLTRDELSRANQELLKLNRLKSLFLSIAAHDLRSPLTAVRGYTDLALKSIGQDTLPDVNEYLSIVVSLVDTLNRLISDFLDMDIIEQGRLVIRPEACALNPIVWEVSDFMSSVAERKNVKLETHMLESLPPVLGDPGRIRLILFNLISNAIKYTEDGDSVVIETTEDGQYGVIRVTDHGPGIPESELGKLFDLYHRTEEARQSKVKGFGLGLFIVKSLVELQNGQILVNSEVNKGTSFTIYLPFNNTATKEEKR